MGQSQSEQKGAFPYIKFQHLTSDNWHYLGSALSVHDASKAVLQEVSTYSLLSYTELSLTLNLKHVYKAL